MSATVQVRPSETKAGLRPTFVTGYQFRPTSFFASVGVHTLAILALGLIPPYQDEPVSKRPIYDELIKPNEHKIVYYDYKKPLPDVTATERIGTFPKPRGRELSRDAIIAAAPRAKSAKQIIWRPVPKIEIQKDLPAPNIVLRAATAIPVLAPPPPEPKKIDKPNVEAPRAEQANLSTPNPQADPNRAQPEATKPIEIPKPRRAFVPPPASKQPPRLPVPVEVADVPVPDASITGSGSAARMALPDGIGTAAFSKGAPPPPPNAPPGPENNAGNGKTDVAAVSLNPGNGPVPDGARSGAFSRAPIVGDPASGEVGGNGLKVPNLTIRGAAPVAEAPKVGPNKKVVLYADKLRSIPVTTLSVPLRPASRTIPRAIEGRFQGRNVYTIVVPIENFEPYSGDWIVWFAERQPKGGDTPFVRAPVPLRKYESVEPVLPGAKTELRVQVSGTIRQDGKLEGLAILRSLSPGIEQAVIQDLSAWEFKPATRDSAPVDVDVVIEVPYSLPPQIAKSAP